MLDFSASTIGFMFALSVVLIVTWKYFSSEKKRENFLSDRIRDFQAEENLKKSARQEKIEKKISDVGSKYTYQSLMQKSIMIMIGSLVLGYALDILPLSLLFVGAGYKFPELMLTFEKDRMDKEFEKQLPDSIEQLLAIIRSGLTPLQGYQVLSEEASFPTNHEFARIHNDIQTGASHEKALTDFYERHPINDIKLFMTGMIIAAEATPQVAINTLITISDTIRNRASQKKSAKSAIMQGKYAAIILSLAPVVALAVMLTFMPNYIGPFIDSFMGKILIVVALILDGVGYMIASKITASSSIVKY